jgi:hypothetical protein
MRAAVFLLFVSLLPGVAAAQDAAKNVQTSSAPPPEAAAPMASVKIPDGTLVELETAYTINSQLVRRGDAVSFRVVNPVILGGAVVIEKGATATAIVTRAERGRHFGRAGRIEWAMKEVTAADGSRVPLDLSGHVVGDSHGASVAARMAVTGALLGPAAPLALLYGFKRGENAFVLEGQRFNAVTRGAAEVRAVAK